MDYGSYGMGQANDCIETASATTSPHNEGSLPFALGMAGAAIIGLSMLFTGMFGCSAYVLDNALDTYGDELLDYPTYTHELEDEPWYDYDPFEDDVVDEFGTMDDQLNRLFNEGPREAPRV